VVFAAGRAQRYPRSRIYMIAIDGSQRRALARGDQPSWSSDGRHIVFQRNYASVGIDAARRGVFIIRPDGTHLRRLTASTGDGFPSFSPDGRRVAFVRQVGSPLPVDQQRAEWRTIDITGRDDTLVASHLYSPFSSRYGAPQWAPDGTRLGALREDTSTPISTVAFVTVSPTGTDERVEFTFPRRPSGYTYYARDFSWRPR
jgi:dipeptidyl aminopeptidase/acylaminoacyl peptidase